MFNTLYKNLTAFLAKYQPHINQIKTLMRSY